MRFIVFIVLFRLSRVRKTLKVSLLHKINNSSAFVLNCIVTKLLIVNSALLSFVYISNSYNSGVSMFTLLNSYGDTKAVFACQKFILMGMCDDVEWGRNWGEVGM